MKLKIRDMKTTGILEFEGLKFKNTEFQFRNKKEMNDYFNDVLIDSPIRFINTLDRWTLENMHIAFSQFMVLKFVAYGALGLAFLSILTKAPSTIGIGLTIMAIANYIGSKRAEKKLDNMNFGRGNFDNMAEYLDEVRDELIKERNSK
jgi:hypothetical protein